jgi:hypothetical protein
MVAICVGQLGQGVTKLLFGQGVTKLLLVNSDICESLVGIFQISKIL